MALVPKMFSPRVVEQHGRDHAGVFTWDVDGDLFFADEAVARVFDITPHEAERGLPLLDYLDRIHPDDRARAAKSLHDTILSGGPCQQDYRILQRHGPPVQVMAFGRCFKGRNGGATHYAGIIQPVPSERVSISDLHVLCVATHKAAMMAGEMRIAGYLAEALTEF